MPSSKGSSPGIEPAFLPQGLKLYLLQAGSLPRAPPAQRCKQQELTKPLSGNNIELPKPTRVFT